MEAHVYTIVVSVFFLRYVVYIPYSTQDNTPTAETNFRPGFLPNMGSTGNENGVALYIFRREGCRDVPIAWRIQYALSVVETQL